MVGIARTIEREEARGRVDRTLASPCLELAIPKVGWIRTMRIALGMSGEALARRMGLSRTAGIRLENSERSEGISLKSLQAAAGAMNCRLVYALVPIEAESVEELVQRQITRKVQAMLASASSQMALEVQALDDEATAAESRRLVRELSHRMPRDLWDD